MSYEQSAPYYDAIYTRMKDYAAETCRLAELIRQYRRPELPPRSRLDEAMGLDSFKGLSLLDVACGTGLHLSYLAPYGFERLVGIDLDPAMLKLAREHLHPFPSAGLGRNVFQADMRTFGFRQPFDVVTCLFSAIGHLPAVDMPLAVANMALHLKPGGVLVIEPWLLPHMWRPGLVGLNVVDRQDLKVARISRTRREGNILHLEMDYLIGRPDGTEHFVELHKLTMIGVDGFRAAFECAGLEFIHDPKGLSDNGRGLFIGRKPLAS